MKTKFDKNDEYHQILAGVLALFVDKFGYTTRELCELLEDTKNNLFFTLLEIEKEKERKSHD